MSQKNIRKLLSKYQLPTWKLIQKLNISRNTYYKWSHTNFKGHITAVKHAIHSLITKVGVRS